MKVVESFNLGGKELKNRFVSAPFGEPSGGITEKQIPFFSRIARGGVAL